MIARMQLQCVSAALKLVPVKASQKLTYRLMLHLSNPNGMESLMLITLCKCR